jgi:hypothetical protein
VYVANNLVRPAQEERFGVTRVTFDPECALTRPIGAPVRAETTLLPAEPTSAAQTMMRDAPLAAAVTGVDAAKTQAKDKSDKFHHGPKMQFSNKT